MTHPTNPDAIKVKRDGPHGWHWVAMFDPAIHELYDAPEAAPKRGRPAKKEA